MELNRARAALGTGQSLLLDRNELAATPKAPRLVLGRGIAGLEAAQNHLAQFLRSVGCHKRTLYRAEIVLKETVLNIRQHGELPDRPARVWVEAWLTEQHAVIAVEDDGPPFDPQRLIAAPANNQTRGAVGGGLRQIRRNADTVRYARTPIGHNRLELHVDLES
jgi:anti-sigma regulatory factor (Ser/Thr protein kinase)